MKYEKNNSSVIRYGNNDVSEEFVRNALKAGPIYCTLSGAGRKSSDPRTNAAIPSDDAVEEMRDWSIVCEI